MRTRDTPILANLHVVNKENPIKVIDLGVPPFQETSICFKGNGITFLICEFNQAYLPSKKMVISHSYVAVYQAG